METFTCGTAPGVVFNSRTEMYQHYKTDWHRYNLKRKVAGLPPVPKEFYDRLKEAADRRAQGKTAEHKQDHVKKDKRNKMKKKAEKKQKAKQQPTPQPLPAPVVQSEPIRKEEDPVEQPKDEEEMMMEFDEKELEKKYDDRVCIFDEHISKDLQSNLLYMQQKYGFFVPDAEYVSDLPGLFQYCAKKVKVGRLCLYCGRFFNDATACVQHMIAKSHCKVKWEDDEDMEEYDSFYDFSSSWIEEENVEVDGEVQSVKKSPLTMEVADSGELLFKDGDNVRRIGVRQFKSVYKQRFRPEDTREAVKANEKERLLLCYKNVGVETKTALSLWRMKTGKLMSKQHMNEQKRTYRYQQRRNLAKGIGQNLLIKNRIAGKNMGAGFGVHG